MARSIEEIRNEMLAAKEAQENLSSLTSNAASAVWRTIIYVVSFIINTLEKLFDKFLQDIDDILRSKRPHTPGWYRQTALNFQYGKELSADVAEYDNTGLTDEEISAQRIVTKCAVSKAADVKPTLVIKVSKSDTYLTAAEKAAFAAYMNEKADAGVMLDIITGEPDRLWLSILIRYDGLTLDSDGNGLSGNNNPVKDAILEHLNNLTFNGTFYPSLLEQDLMKLTGIKVATIQAAQAAPQGQSLVQFPDAYQPSTGALKIDVDADLIVTYELI